MRKEKGARAELRRRNSKGTWEWRVENGGGEEPGNSRGQMIKVCQGEGWSTVTSGALVLVSWRLREALWHLPGECRDGLSIVIHQDRIMYSLIYLSCSLAGHWMQVSWGFEVKLGIHIPENVSFTYKDRQSVMHCADLRGESDNSQNYRSTINHF